MKRFRGMTALLALAACAPQPTVEENAFLHELAGRPVTCKGKDDCEDKWNRAIDWISKHSATGIRGVSKYMIETRSIADNSNPPRHFTEFSVVRYARGDGKVMDFKSYCDYGFACNPSALKLRAGFVTYVMGPPPGVSLGVDGESATRTIHH